MPARQFDAALEILAGIRAEPFQPIGRISALIQISRIGLCVWSFSVRAGSQIARVLAVRELVFAIFKKVVHFWALNACIYKTRTKKMSDAEFAKSRPDRNDAVSSKTLTDFFL